MARVDCRIAGSCHPPAYEGNKKPTLVRELHKAVCYSCFRF